MNNEMACSITDVKVPNDPQDGDRLPDYEPEYEPDPNVNRKALVVTDRLGKTIIVSKDPNENGALGILVKSNDGAEMIVSIDRDVANRMCCHIRNAFDNWRA